MHDGSLKTLKEVMIHYNNGGVTKRANRSTILSGVSSAEFNRPAAGRRWLLRKH
jgi:hypothetical protein